MGGMGSDGKTAQQKFSRSPARSLEALHSHAETKRLEGQELAVGMLPPTELTTSTKGLVRDAQDME